VIPDQGLTGFVDVVLVQSPPGKNAIQVIQALRQATDLGLTEAKAAVENLPTVICRSVKAADGERIRAALEKVGGKAVLKAA
jgi:large subunit ribosomal protein L7/L12